MSINKGKINSFKSALSCDPTSAFGGIVSCNFKLDEKTAKEINKIFFEIVLADGLNFQAEEYFDITRNNWILKDFNSKFSEAYTLCKEKSTHSES